mgnify:FL=1
MIGCSPETGFDCSGLALYVLGLVNISVPADIRHCSEFFDRFGVYVHYKFRQPGDLVFFSPKGRAPRHMGIMIDNHKYIHSPGKNGEKVGIAKLHRETLAHTGKGQLYTENPIGFKRVVIKSGRWNILT